MSNVPPLVSRFELAPWPFDDDPERDPLRDPDLESGARRDDPNCRHIIDIIPLWSGHQQVIWVPCRRVQDSIGDPGGSARAAALRTLCAGSR